MIDEKEQLEREARENEEVNTKILSELSAELRALEEQLLATQRNIKNVEEECYTQSKLLTDKDEELKRLKRDYEVLEETNAQGGNKKRSLELEVDSLNKARVTAEQEANSLASLNERLHSERTDLEMHTRSAASESNALLKRIEETERRLELAKKKVVEKELEIDSEIRSKNINKEQIINLNSLNTRFEDENEVLSIKIIELENSIARKQRQHNDSSTILSIRDKELDHAISTLTYSESKNTLVLKELEQAQNDNNTLQRLLDKYRQDVDFQKKLREIESAKKIELEIERRRLEQQAVSKDIEARVIKKELEQMKGSHGWLLESNWQINEELSALKEHTEVLENQNKTLNNELEDIVDKDEIVRRDLDIKARVDYIKSKNNNEVQRSIIRVQNSRSPKRSVHNSPYKY